MPDRLIVAGLMNYVFERDYALLVTVQVPAGAEPGATVPIDARLDYLVCTDQVCVPETANVTVELAIGAARNPSPLFQAYRQALPRPLGSEGRFEVANGRLRIAIPLPAATAVSEPYFFPATLDALRYAAPQSISRNGDMLIVETAAGPAAGAAAGARGRARDRARHRPGADRPAGTGAGRGHADQRPAASRRRRRWRGRASCSALLGALLGGLILNIMPCVFPILSLKALSLARAGGTEAEARREALAYAAGVVLICLALGGLLLGLRAGGAMVGWAFQLQDPRVILLLLLLVTAIALNLAGLFELPVLAGGERLAQKGGADRRLLHRRARRLRRHALHRPVHGRGAGRGAGAARGWARWRCSPASGSASLCRSCCSASSRRCAGGCRSRAVDGDASSASSRCRCS